MFTYIFILILTCGIKAYGALQCYNCTDIANSSTCTSNVTCDKAEKCFSQVRDTSSGARFDLGCRAETECIDPAAPLFVGRAAREGPACLSCCDRDLCNKDLCILYQRDIDWRPWSEWSVCSSSCGDGVSVRQRHCTESVGCVGNTTETRGCIVNQCTKVAWSEWSDWSRCSATCNFGMETRTRACSVLLGCTGTAAETRVCFLPQCTDNTWADWSGWSPCTASCDMGLKTRTRHCAHFGSFCTGHSVEIDYCARTPCPVASTQSVNTTTSLGTTGGPTPQTFVTTPYVPTSSTGMARPSTVPVNSSLIALSTLTSPSIQPSTVTTINTSITPSSISSVISSLSTISLNQSTSTSPFATETSATSPATVTAQGTTQLVTCISRPPYIDHGYFVNMTAKTVVLKCLTGYGFVDGNIYSKVLCDQTTKTWGPLPECRAIEHCSKDDDCNNAGSCDSVTHRCQCALGFFNTNCDHLLVVGAMVIRGPDWKWLEQDGGGPGVITSLNGTRPRWVNVFWNVTGLEREYRVGFENKYDLRPYVEV